MDRALANEFLAACNNAFGFLVEEHGFKPPSLEIDDQIHFAIVSYLARNVAVES